MQRLSELYKKTAITQYSNKFNVNIVLCVVVYIKRKKKLRGWCEVEKKPQNQIAFIALFDTHTKRVMRKKEIYIFTLSIQCLVFVFDVWYRYWEKIKYRFISKSFIRGY